MLEETEGLNKLFFEFASESRLGVLQELQKKDLKMQEIARRLDLTTTETFRQLQRLSDALLIQKQPEGSYVITNYGKTVLQLLPSLEFIFKHKSYFSNHDIRRLPYQFINRIGELSKATLIMDTIESMNEGERIFLEAEEYAWGLTEHPRGPTQMGSQMGERIRKGVKTRFLHPGLLFDGSVAPELARNIEVRAIPEAPVIVGVTEKEAAVCFRFTDGRMDYAGFIGSDPMFHGWARDLFLFYWDRDKDKKPEHDVYE